MKRADRLVEMARERRARRIAERAQRRQKRIARAQRTHSTPQREGLVRALAPLRATLMASLGLSSFVGCQVSEPVRPEGTAGVEAGDTGGVVAGESAGTTTPPAGEIAGAVSPPAGEVAGDIPPPAGEVAGEIMAGDDRPPAGEIAGDIVAGDDRPPAGEIAGDIPPPAGDMAGVEIAGDVPPPAGEVAGTGVAGDTPPPIEFCEEPVVQTNRAGEPNGYTACERGIWIKTGPANCLADGEFGDCDTDADCGEGAQCACSNIFTGFAMCVSASCNTGADCDTGGCGFSFFDDGCSTEVSLECYTEMDACQGFEDCRDEGGDFCYSAGAEWMCGSFQCAVGRPLTEEGDCQVAPLELNTDWTSREEVTLCAEDLSAEARVEIERFWSEVAQLEHSSVASFARFTLEMMALGAPADLLFETQQAAADEVRHAQRAAELLSALRGAHVGFGSLPIDQLKVSADRGEILERLIREACFGETLGVAEVTEQARLCTDPEIQAYLIEVRDDETRHAGLAWRSLRWLIDSAPEADRDELAQRARDIFDELCRVLILGSQATPAQLASQARADERSSLTAQLNRFGVLSEAQAQRARLVAYHEVIRPCVEGLSVSQIA